MDVSQVITSPKHRSGAYLALLVEEELLYISIDDKAVIERVTPRYLYPTNFNADAAFDARYVYDPFARRGGLAFIPLSLRGHPEPKLRFPLKSLGQQKLPGPTGLCPSL